MKSRQPNKHLRHRLPGRLFPFRQFRDDSSPGRRHCLTRRFWFVTSREGSDTLQGHERRSWSPESESCQNLRSPFTQSHGEREDDRSRAESTSSESAVSGQKRRRRHPCAERMILVDGATWRHVRSDTDIQRREWVLSKDLARIRQHSRRCGVRLSGDSLRRDEIRCLELANASSAATFVFHAFGAQTPRCPAFPPESPELTTVQLCFIEAWVSPPALRQVPGPRPNRFLTPE